MKPELLEKIDRAMAARPVDANEVLAVVDVLNERARQHAKWGTQCHDMMTWLAILHEETGELAEACLHDKFGGPEAENVLSEAIQVAAVALQIVEHLRWQLPTLIDGEDDSPSGPSQPERSTGNDEHPTPGLSAPVVTGSARNRYRLVRRCDPTSLMEIVAQYLDSGWTVVGGIAVAQDFPNRTEFFQALIKRVPISGSPAGEASHE